MPPPIYFLQSAIMLLVAAVALFGSAGTVAVGSFWLYLAILAGVTVSALALVDPDLMDERARPGGQRPPRVLHLAGLIPLLGLILAGLDRGRLHWTGSVPIWLQAFGLVVTAAGFAIFVWAMAVNRFFSSVARIQADRGQRVVTEGPYRWVRHPGYAAAILIVLASGPALGSWLTGVLWIATGIPFLYRRITFEDPLLQSELPGYRDYARAVRWRVLPGVW